MSDSDTHPLLPEFDVAQLHGRMPLLDVDALRPGDVLLLRGRKSHSKLIAKQTGGRFSHAAIWMPTGVEDINTPILAEADSAGVGFTPLLPMGIHYKADVGASMKPMRTVYSIPGRATEYVLLRHPEMSGVGWDRLRSASEALQRAVFYRTYSAYPRLLEAANLPASTAMLATALTKLAERARRDKGTRGAFCSELVAMYFARLGLELFPFEKRPEQISPNDLFSDSCYLEVVENAFLSASDLVGAIGGYGGNNRDPRKTDLFKAQIKKTTDLDRFVEQTDRLRTSFDQAAQATTRAYVAGLDQIDRQFQTRIASAIARGDNARADKLQRHMLMARYGRHLMTATENRTAIVRRGHFSDTEIRNWNDAANTLHRMAHQLSSTALEALSRDGLLLNFRMARKLKRDGALSRRESVRSARARRELLRGWRKQKKSMREALGFINEFLKVDDLSEEAVTHITLAMQDRQDAILAELEANGKEREAVSLR